MLIRIPRGWEISEREATPERVYANRREILRAAGFLGAGALFGARSLHAAADRAWFKPGKRNPEFNRADITEEFAATGFNNFYEFTVDKKDVKNKVDKFKVEPWKVEITGLVNNKVTLDLDDLARRFPAEECVYRFRCVEAWSMVVPWTGFPLAELVKLADPKAEAKYLRWWTVSRPAEMPGMIAQPWYKWPYYEGLRLDEATNPLALVVTGVYGKPLPRQNGAPIRIATPWKYGFKSIKSIVRIEFVKSQPRTFWNDSVPDEYGFYANVTPNKPHPRWSQATDKRIPTMAVETTPPYNGYEKWVAGLYNGKEY